MLTREECDGLDLRFGNTEAMLAMVEKIAFREGIGDLLAQGSARAAVKIGRGAERFAIQVNGQEVPMHEPRGKQAVGPGYAVSDTGVDHLVVAHDPAFQMKGSLILKSMEPFGIFEPISALDLGPAKVRLFSYLESINSLWKAAGVCNFGYAPRVAIPFEKFVSMVQANTGWNANTFDMLKVGERCTNLSHAFNVREGQRRSGDRVPDRFHEPLPDGRLKGVSISREGFEGALTLLNQMKGWDPETTVPRPSEAVGNGLGLGGRRSPGNRVPVK